MRTYLRLLLVILLLSLGDQIHAMGAQEKGMAWEVRNDSRQYTSRAESTQERVERERAEKLQRQKEAQNRLIQTLLIKINAVNDLDELNAYALQGILLNSLDLVKAAIKKGASNFQVFYLFAKENKKQEVLPFLATEFINYRKEQENQLNTVLSVVALRPIITSYVFSPINAEEEQALWQAAKESTCSIL